MNRRMRALFVALVAVFFVFGIASPALADGAVTRVGLHDATVKYLQRATNGGYIKYLQKGQTAGGVVWVTSNTPFYVTVSGGGRICARPGQLVYPNNGGVSQAMKIEPTVRC